MKGAVCICDNSVGRVGHMIRHILYGMKMLGRQGISQGTKLNVLTLQSSLFLVEPLLYRQERAEIGKPYMI